jgi:hypothetical protein
MNLSRRVRTLLIAGLCFSPGLCFSATKITYEEALKQFRRFVCADIAIFYVPQEADGPEHYFRESDHSYIGPGGGLCFIVNSAELMEACKRTTKSLPPMWHSPYCHRKFIKDARSSLS